MVHYAIQFFLYSLQLFVHFHLLVVHPLSLSGVVPMSPFSRPICTVHFRCILCKCASVKRNRNRFTLHSHTDSPAPPRNTLTAMADTSPVEPSEASSNGHLVVKILTFLELAKNGLIGNLPLIKW